VNSWKKNEYVKKTCKTVKSYWWNGCCLICIIVVSNEGGNAMSLGNNLFKARKKKGLSQEEAAERLGVSRQTISKWEVDETLPDIRQSKNLAVLYGLSLDEFRG